MASYPEFGALVHGLLICGKPANTSLRPFVCLFFSFPLNGQGRVNFTYPNVHVSIIYNTSVSNFAGFIHMSQGRHITLSAYYLLHDSVCAFFHKGYFT